MNGRVVKKVSKKTLAKEVAVEVVKMLEPRLNKMITEHNKRILSRTRKIVKEEIRELVYHTVVSSSKRDESDDLFEDEPVRKKKANRIDDAKLTIAKRKAGKIAEEIFTEHDITTSDGIDSLIDSAVPSNAVLVEGGDKTYRKTELINRDSVDENTILDADPANVDWGDLVDAMDEKDKSIG